MSTRSSDLNRRASSASRQIFHMNREPPTNAATNMPAMASTIREMHQWKA